MVAVTAMHKYYTVVVVRDLDPQSQSLNVSAYMKKA
jgi:hypothetical protein